LDGSIRYQIDPAERGTWYDLLLFSALCSDDGSICDGDQRPYPHSFIANRLNISEKLLETTLKKCKAEGRLTEDEYGIHITNWKIYQSEYQRQKPFREKAKASWADRQDPELIKALSPDRGKTSEATLGYTYEMFCQDEKEITKTYGYPLEELPVDLDISITNDFKEKYGEERGRWLAYHFLSIRDGVYLPPSMTE